MRPRTDDNSRRRVNRGACRGVVRAAVFLVLGAMMTIAVAWAAALLSMSADIHFYRGTDEIQPLDGIVDWAGAVHDGKPFAFRLVARGWGRRYDESSDMTPWTATSTPRGFMYLPAEGQPNTVSSTTITGWPMYSMGMSSQWSLSLMNQPPPAEPVGIAAVWKHGIQIHQPSRNLPFGNEHTHLPLRPLPLGFLIDTLLYAAVFAGVWFGFGSYARRRRRRRGLCPRCAYPVLAGAEPPADVTAQPAKSRGQTTVFSPSAPPRCPECGSLI